MRLVNYNKLGEILFFGGLASAMILLLFMILSIMFDLQFDSIIHRILEISGILLLTASMAGAVLYLVPIAIADYKRDLEKSKKA